jgi:hypothetical protein
MRQSARLHSTLMAPSKSVRKIAVLASVTSKRERRRMIERVESANRNQSRARRNSAQNFGGGTRRRTVIGDFQDVRAQRCATSNQTHFARAI